ncbi:cell division protein ZipA C-terminal FtsZ-binding domain-containing protein [Acinetobacter sp.]|jgi:cell division protein ZipA|uniref:cell division protein ZipA C-terminal FtsZ-binding domain-containing protein n=1 Tax=Acinetobacter sp. TaxID=472 RepID=UPI0035ADA1BE
MEITTIVGIVVAVILILVGLKLVLKKPSDAAPSLDSELHIDPDSQQPVIPRHVRSQLNAADAPAERVEPTLAAAEAEEAAPAAQAETELDLKAEEAAEQPAAETPDAADAAAEGQAPASAETAQETPAEKLTETQEAEKAPELSLNQIEKAEISEFEDESNILDAHLYEQKLVDDESALATAETYIALNVYPDSRALSGEKMLKVLLKYGLRFGEMACFHRYSEDGSRLLFSVLQISNDGATGFDLETLSTEQVKGLAFFLALPHGDVQIAFDTMDSVSRLIAREIEGTVYDQNNQEFTPQLREHWRHQAIDYRPGQTAAEA